VDKNIPQPKLFDPKTGAPVSLPPDQIPQAVASGKAAFIKGDKIPVLNPDGETGEIPAEEAQASFQHGYSYEPLDSQVSRAEKHEYGDGVGNEIKAGLAGVARGVTLGGSDAALTSTGLVKPETLDGLQKYNPVVSGAGEVGGIVLPAVLSGGIAAEAEGAAGAARAAARLTPAALVGRLGAGVTEGVAARMGGSGLAARIASTVIPKAAGSAVEGAFYGAGNSVSEASLGDHDLNAEKVMSNVGLGILIGGGVGSIFGAGEGALAKFAGKSGAAAKEAENLAVKDAALNGTPEAQSASMALPSEAPKAAPGSFDEINERIKGAKFQALDGELPQKQELIDADTLLANDTEFRPHRIQVDSLSDQGKRDLYKTRLEMQTPEGESLRTYEAIQKKEGVSKLQGQIEGVAPGYKPAGTVEESGSRIVDAIKTPYDAEKKELGPAFKRIDEIAGKTEATQQDVLDIAKKAVPELEPYVRVTPEGLKLAPYSSKMGIGEDVYKVMKGVVRDIQDGPLNVSDVRNIREAVAAKIDPMGNPKVNAKLGNLKKSLMDYMENKIQQAAPDQAVRDVFKRYAQNEERRDLAEYILGGKLDDRGALKRAIVPEDVVSKMFSDSSTVHAVKELMGSQKFNEVLSDYMSLNKAKATNNGAFSSKSFASFLKSKAPELRAAFEDKPDALNKIIARNKIMTILPDSVSVNPAGTAKTAMMMIGKMGDLIKHPTGVIGDGLRHISDSFENGRAAAQMDAELGGREVPQSMAARIREYTGLKNLEENSAAVSRGIVNAAKSFFSIGSSAATRAAVPSSVGYLEKNRMDNSAPDRSKKKRQEMYAKRYDEISKAISDPSALVDNVANSVSPIGAFAPNIASSMSTKAVQAAQFLYDKAPKDPVGQTSLLPHLRKYQPSDAEISKWERYVTAVDHPMSVMKDLKSGVLAREGVEAVQTVYPRLYQEMQSSLMEEMTSLKENIPYQKRLQLATFFGTPTDASGAPDFVAYMQGIHAANPQDNQKQSGVSAAKAKNMQLAENQKTDSESLMTRA
jgi:hypothetical protein